MRWVVGWCDKVDVSDEVGVLDGVTRWMCRMRWVCWMV